MVNVLRTAQYAGSQSPVMHEHGSPPLLLADAAVLSVPPLILGKGRENTRALIPQRALPFLFFPVHGRGGLFFLPHKPIQRFFTHITHTWAGWQGEGAFTLITNIFCYKVVSLIELNYSVVQYQLPLFCKVVFTSQSNNITLGSLHLP